MARVPEWPRPMTIINDKANLLLALARLKSPRLGSAGDMEFVVRLPAGLKRCARRPGALGHHGVGQPRLPATLSNKSRHGRLERAHHIGPCFGDDFELDPEDIEYALERDREDLAQVCAMNQTAFYQSVLKDDNERHVCGLKAIYSALYTLQDSATQGEILDLDDAHDPAGGVVTFTSIALR